MRACPVLLRCAALVSVLTFAGYHGRPAQAAFITPINVTTPNSVDGNAVPVNLINHNGLTTAGTHTQTFLTQNFWRTTNAAGSVSLTFDLGAQFDLNQAHIWNYNESGTGGGAAANTDRGLKNISLSFSRDNVTFVEAQNYTLAQANGSSAYAGETLAIGLSQGVRYVRISGIDSYGSNNGFTGLSEVRFNTTTPEIMPVNVLVNQAANGGGNSGNNFFSIANLTNDTGMSGFGNELSVAASNPGYFGQWRQQVSGGNTVDGSEIKFDFGTSQDIGAIKIWNYNESGQLARGIETFSLYQSDDDVLYSLVGDYTLQQASALHDVIDLNGMGVNARYLRFNLNSAFNGGGAGAFYGLGEVRFFATASAVPEPSTLLMAGLGALLALSRVRRRLARRDVS